MKLLPVQQISGNNKSRTSDSSQTQVTCLKT